MDTISTNAHELLHGTLDVLILKALADDAGHGYEIVRRITAATANAIAIEDGSLYPALYRLEKKRQIRGQWGVTAGGRRARFYRLTPRGRAALEAQTATWARFAAAVSKLLLGGQS